MLEGSDQRAFDRYFAAFAQNPDDIGPLNHLCLKHLEKYPHQVVDRLEHAFRMAPPASGMALVQRLHLLTWAKEVRGRRAAGVSTSNAAGFDDTNFSFAGKDFIAYGKAALLAAKQGNIAAYEALIDFLVSSGQTAQAETILGEVRPVLEESERLSAVSNFSPAYHESLDQPVDAAAQSLPPISWVRERGQECENFIFVSADHKYFQKFGPVFLASFQAYRTNDVGLLLHVMDVTEDELPALLSQVDGLNDVPAVVTTEWTGLRQDEATTGIAKGYYHTIRFVRASQLLDRYPNVRMWLHDIDIRFVGSIAPLFKLLEGHDVSLRFNAARVEIRNKIMAGMIGIAPSAPGRNLLRRFANYMAACWHKRQLPWGADQVALYAILNHLRGMGSLPNIVPIPETVCGDRQEKQQVFTSQ